MSDPSVGGNATLSGIVDALDRVKDYFSGYKPDARSVTYDYRNQTSEMTLKITVPDNLGRHARGRSAGKVQIPRARGYEFREMFSSEDFAPVRAPWTKTESYWVLDPTNLPPGENYMIRLDKRDIDAEEFTRIIDLNVPDDPVTKNGVDQYWVQSAIKDPRQLEATYEELKVDNVDLDIRVGVQRCFSNAIPDDVLEGFKRWTEVRNAENRNEVVVAHRRFRKARKRMKMSEGELANYIRSLASAEQFEEFISIDSPYRRQEIEPTAYEHAIFPEQIRVSISTNLSLEQKAAKGTLEFHKEDYEEHIRDETEDLV